MRTCQVQLREAYFFFFDAFFLVVFFAAFLAAFFFIAILESPPRACSGLYGRPTGAAGSSGAQPLPLPFEPRSRVTSSSMRARSKGLTM